jgi:hypothetical protein
LIESPLPHYSDWLMAREVFHRDKRQTSPQAGRMIGEMKYILPSLLVLGVVLCPAETKKLTKPSLPEQMTPRYDSKPFDVMQKTLPRNYLGNDFVTIVHKLLKVESSLHKSDYEATNAFNDRRAAANGVSLLRTVNAPDPTAFVVRVNQKYWADDGRLDAWVNLYSSHPSNPSDMEREGISLRYTDIKDVGTYQAANAFGAVRTVQVSDWTNYTLEIPPISSSFRVNKHSYQDSEISGVQELDALLASFDISPKEALELRNNLRALVVVRLEPPYARQSDRDNGPTLDDPYFARMHDLIMYVRPIALWFFDSKTGAILKKVSLAP